MKKLMYGTIALFVIIMLVVWIIAAQHPVRMVTYQNGEIVESTK